MLKIPGLNTTLKSDISLSDISNVSAVWNVVPNSTIAERQAVQNYSKSSDLTGQNYGTNFRNVEDVEIHPLTGDVYFTAKNGDTYGGVYKFTDNGDGTVSNFDVFLRNGVNYKFTKEGGADQAFKITQGCDNLTFDNEGNLYLQQDGGNDMIYFIKNGFDESTASTIAQMSIFMKTPTGAEPTGMTFTPDGRYAFISIQHPSGSTSQTDATGNDLKWNVSRTIVVARKEFLGGDLNPSIQINDGLNVLESDDTIDFGTVNLSSPETKLINLSNNSSSDNLVVDFMALSHARFSLLDNEPKFIKPNESSSYNLEFEAVANQAYSGNMYLYTNAIGNEEIRLRLAGTGDSTLSFEKKLISPQN